MDLFFTMLVPLTIASIALYAAGRGVDVYSALVQGAGSGLETLVKIDRKSTRLNSSHIH